ncbi:MAG: hypothetical protein Phog2KO_10920 [Phototrophicaceae bacterium]
MDRQLIKNLRDEINKYSGDGLNSQTYLTENLLQNVFTSTTINKDDNNANPFVDLFVRVIDTIIIEEDRNSKPLFDALLQAGIPRENIILAYAGEKVPDIS